MKPNNTNIPTGANVPPTPSLYRIPTVMHLLDVSRATVYRLIAKGDLELVKLSSRASRITSASVERIISGSRRQE